MYSAAMARTIPPDRFRQLVDCATRVFIEQGYARTQMADVAAAMGIAKGTLYLYVESKEALYDLVLRCADAQEPLETPAKLPLPTPRSGATLQYVRKRLREQVPLPALVTALSREKVADPRGELATIVREIYGTLGRNRHAIKLGDRSAQFHPDLASVWFEGGRGTLVDALARYLETRIRRKLFRAVPDATVAARVIVETIVTWAVHRHWDPSPQVLDDKVVEDTVVQFVLGGLLKEVKP
jgi:AcrR family transcriptional regulator